MDASVLFGDLPMDFANNDMSMLFPARNGLEASVGFIGAFPISSDFATTSSPSSSPPSYVSPPTMYGGKYNGYNEEVNAFDINAQMQAQQGVTTKQEEQFNNNNNKMVAPCNSSSSSSSFAPRTSTNNNVVRQRRSSASSKAAVDSDSEDDGRGGAAGKRKRASSSTVRFPYTAIACSACRQRKRKCDGKCPCSFCLQRNEPCQYRCPEAQNVGNGDGAEGCEESGMEQALIEINSLQVETRRLRALLESIPKSKLAAAAAAVASSSSSSSASACAAAAGASSSASSSICTRKSSAAAAAAAAAAAKAAMEEEENNNNYGGRKRMRASSSHFALPAGSVVGDNLLRMSKTALSMIDLDRVLDAFFSSVGQIFSIVSLDEIKAEKYSEAVPSTNLGAFAVYNALILVGCQMCADLADTCSDGAKARQLLLKVVRESVAQFFDIPSSYRARSLVLLGLYYICIGEPEMATHRLRMAEAVHFDMPSHFLVATGLLLEFARVGGTSSSFLDGLTAAATGSSDTDNAASPPAAAPSSPSKNNEVRNFLVAF